VGNLPHFPHRCQFQKDGAHGVTRPTKSREC
jgi:hypothetical protein